MATAHPLPELARHLWGWFSELHRDRAATHNGPGRITPAMMRDLEWVLGIRMELWERRAIRQLDTAYFKSMSKEISDD